METKDFFTLTLSGLALIVSLIVAARTWRYNRAAYRSTSRNNYMNALFTINRELIAHPDLWSVYDPHWRRAPDHDSPTEVARRRGFIWYHINLFELFYTDYHHHRLAPPDSDDRRYWDSWDNYIRSFLRDSDEARAVVYSDESMALLHRDFRDYLRTRLPSETRTPRSRMATLTTNSRRGEPRAGQKRICSQESTQRRSSVIWLMIWHRASRIRSARHPGRLIVQQHLGMRR